MSHVPDNDRSIADSIERFRSGFKSLGIAEHNVKVTWDTEARWARLRMRLASGCIVEKVERAQGDEAVTEPLYRLTQYLHAGARRVRKGETVDAVFCDRGAKESA